MRDAKSDAPHPSYDVFLSYAREDAYHAEWACQILKAHGWSVWFDRDMVGGVRWRREIDQTLQDAACVVVLWSAASIASHWVMDEAGVGMQRGVLVPALLEDVEIPIGFREAHAINLAKERVRPERAEAALVAGVASVLGRPKVEPPRSSRAARLFRRLAPLATVILPLAIGLPLLLRPATELVIDLDVSATEIAFASARDQDLTDLLVLSSLDATGLESVHLPRVGSIDGRVLSRSGGAELGLRLAADTESSVPGTITLESIRISEGTRVALVIPDSQSARMSLAGASEPIAISLDGALRVGLGGGDTERWDLRAPRPLSVESSARGVDLVLRGLDSELGLASSPVQVDEMSLARIEETLETTRSEVAVVSSIRSGTIRFHALDGPAQPLGAGEPLRLGGVRGEIRDLALEDGTLRMRFSGSVESLASCTVNDECESLMPSTLESLVVRKPAWLFAVGVTYVLMLTWLSRASFRRTGRLARLAVLVIALGTVVLIPASGVSARVQDPDAAVRRLIVRLESAVGFGSGIIAGTRSDTLFVATANHVVRGGRIASDTVDVRFYWQPDTPVRATLLPHASDSLDLAVVAVTPLSVVPPDTTLPGLPPDAEQFNLNAIPFDRVGNLDVLERGDPIWLLGHPNGLPWRMNSTPERFIGSRGESLDFESNLLARGHSGGALLNEDREVVGMLKSDQAPYGEAVNIYAIARTLEEWGYAVDLTLRAPQLSAGERGICVLSSHGATQCVDFYELGPRMRSISLGSTHACGIARGGGAFCVGSNLHGQLGDGTMTNRYEPTQVAGGLEFESISAGWGHTCGVVANGDVYCWGLAEGGQLGTRFTEDERSLPSRVPTTERFRMVTAGWYYTCGLTIEGGAWCWGSVGAQLHRRSSPPTRVAPGTTFRSLTAGVRHVCGLTEAGRAHCWGFNAKGQLGVGTSDDSLHEAPQPVAGGHVFRSISTDGTHVCGATDEGAAWCWGLNNFGQLGDGTKEDRAAPVLVSGSHVFRAISAANLQTCGLTLIDEVWCWGLVASPQAGPPPPEAGYPEPVRILTLDLGERRPWRR